MQQPSQMFTPPMNLTTEQIQKCLEENKRLIMAVMENQGNSEACALYLNQLQSNLTFLARIADTQPQASRIAFQGIAEEEKAMSAQAASSTQAAMPSQQQQGGFSVPKSPFPTNDQQQQHQLSYLEQQQLIQNQMGFFSPHPSQTGPGNNFLNLHGNWRDAADTGDRTGK